MKTTREDQEFWSNHAAAFQRSGLTRERYCRQHNLKIYSLDYWRKKLKSSSTAVVSNDSTNRWVTLQVADPPSVGPEAGIRMRIGRLAIEVDRGFDHEVLADVLRVAGSVC